jgi:hypothetical protein
MKMELNEKEGNTNLIKRRRFESLFEFIHKIKKDSHCDCMAR